MLASSALPHARPAIRIHEWSESWVSLGATQAVADVSTSAIERHRLRLVRRHSGGTAVVVTAQLGLTIVLPAGHPLAKSDITQTYAALGPVLLGMTRELGIHDARLAAPADVTAQGRPSGPLRPACLAWLAPYELTWDGRKLVGHAQIRRRGCVLHHCVLNVDFEPALTAEIIDTQGVAVDVAAERLGRAVTSLREALGQAPGSATIRAALLVSLGQLGLDSEPDGLTSAEAAEATRLESTKYGNEEWTLRL